MLGVWVSGWMERVTPLYRRASKYPAKPWHRAAGRLVRSKVNRMYLYGWGEGGLFGGDGGKGVCCVDVVRVHIVCVHIVCVHVVCVHVAMHNSATSNPCYAQQASIHVYVHHTPHLQLHAPHRVLSICAAWLGCSNVNTGSTGPSVA